jgi:hypothetical protein
MGILDLKSQELGKIHGTVLSEFLTFASYIHSQIVGEAPWASY